MARCILHVGMAKTGTKSIQKTLFSTDALGDALYLTDYSAEMLGRKGVHEPRKVKNGKNTALFNAATRSITLGYGSVERFTEKSVRLRRAASTESFVEKRNIYRKGIEQFFLENINKDVVISTEGFMALNDDEFQDFLQTIHHKEILVIAYVRDPFDLAGSRLQQMVRMGRDIPDIKNMNLVADYKKHFVKFLNDRCTLMPIHYDRKNLKNGCVVQDFCERIGVTVRPDQVVQSSPGLSRDAVTLVLHMSRWRKAQGLSHLPLNPLANWLLGGKKIAVHPDLYRKSERRAKKGIAWMEDLLGVKFVEPYEMPHSIRQFEELENISDAAREWVREECGPGDDVGRTVSEAAEVWLESHSDWRRDRSTAEPARRKVRSNAKVVQP